MTDTVHKLEEKINSGTRVILFDCEDTELLYLISEKIKNSKTEIWHSTDGALVNEYLTAIKRKEMDELLEMRSLYDFSDRVSVVSDSVRYGSLFNYVKTGILTKEEMAEAVIK